MEQVPASLHAHETLIAEFWKLLKQNSQDIAGDMLRLADTDTPYHFTLIAAMLAEKCFEPDKPEDREGWLTLLSAYPDDLQWADGMDKEQLTHIQNISDEVMETFGRT
jgi:hypothetical protein